MNHRVLNELEEKELISFFLKEKDNRVSIIAEKFGVSKNTVSRVIDAYFKRNKKLTTKI